MYAFRKPFAAGSYAEIEAVTILGATLQYKTILIISQVIGYCLSNLWASRLSVRCRPAVVLSALLWHRYSMVGALIVRGYSAPTISSASSLTVCRLE